MRMKVRSARSTTSSCHIVAKAELGLSFHGETLSIWGNAIALQKPLLYLTGVTYADVVITVAVGFALTS